MSDDVVVQVFGGDNTHWRNITVQRDPLFEDRYNVITDDVIRHPSVTAEGGDAGVGVLHARTRSRTR